METAKWIGYILLVIIAAYFGVFAGFMVIISVSRLNWNPGTYEVHPMLWVAYIILSGFFLYIASTALTAARTGKWKWWR